MWRQSGDESRLLPNFQVFTVEVLPGLAYRVAVVGAFHYEGRIGYVPVLLQDIEPIGIHDALPVARGILWRYRRLRNYLG
jgi:hypothetical protein